MYIVGSTDHATSVVCSTHTIVLVFIGYLSGVLEHVAPVWFQGGDTVPENHI